MADILKATVVVAGSTAQFRLWCRENGRDPRDRTLIYPATWDRLRGLHDVEVVRFGTWWARSDVVEIENLLRAIRARQDGPEAT